MQHNKQVEEKVKGISLRLMISAVIFLLAAFIFLFLGDEMALEHETGFDLMIFHKLAPVTNPVLTKFMVFITFFGSHYFLLPAYVILILYYLVLRKNRQISLDVASFGILSTIMLFTLKAVFHRARPVDPLIHKVAGFSFPSGHSFSCFTFFGLLIYIIQSSKYMSKAMKTGLSVAFFLFAVMVAFSRIYLHVHYASDVIGGFCLCVVWLVTSVWVIHKTRKDHKSYRHLLRKTPTDN